MNLKNHTVFLLKLFCLMSKLRPIFTEVCQFCEELSFDKKLEIVFLFSQAVSILKTKQISILAIHKEPLLLIFRHLIINKVI